MASGTVDAFDPPLLGIRVIELGRFLSAPWAGQLLADLGADVIKLERPGTGDDIRAAAPFLKDSAGRETRESAYYLSANRNKRSVTVNLSSKEGQDLTRRLVRGADVVLENYKVGDLARYGLAYDDVVQDNRGLVYCSITGYGQTGPWKHRPGFDSMFQALTGMMSVTGVPDGEPGAGPMKFAPSINDLIAGYNASLAIVAALSARSASGGAGQYIDISMLDCATAAMSHISLQYTLSGQLPQRLGTETSGGAPNGVFHCRDGDIALSAGGEQFGILCRTLGMPAIAVDPRFANGTLRWQHRKELRALLEVVLLGRDRAPLLEELGRAGVPAAAVNNVAEALKNPQLQARGMVHDVPHPLAGQVSLVGGPIRMSRSTAVAPAAPPTVGQHTREVLREVLGMSERQIVMLQEAGAV